MVSSGGEKALGFWGVLQRRIPIFLELLGRFSLFFLGVLAGEILHFLGERELPGSQFFLGRSFAGIPSIFWESCRKKSRGEEIWGTLCWFLERDIVHVKPWGELSRYSPKFLVFHFSYSSVSFLASSWALFHRLAWTSRVTYLLWLI